MTNKEAITLVKDAFSIWESEYDTGNDWREEHEACDMAIKALEQQQKVGKWIDAGFDYECTNCEAEINAEIYYMSQSEIKYCPYCGIKLVQTTKMCEEDKE